MRCVQQALNQKLPSGSKQWNVLFRDEAFHAQGRRNVSASVPGVAGVAINMTNSDVEFAPRTQNKVVTFVAQGNQCSFTHGRHPERYELRVFELDKMRTRSPRG